MVIMATTNLTNQRQAFVEEYVRSGDHLEAAKKAERLSAFLGFSKRAKKWYNMVQHDPNGTTNGTT